MPDNQIKGLIAVIILLAIIPSLFFISNIVSKHKRPVLIDQERDALIVEIRDKDAVGGIYFTPRGTTADQLLQSAGFNIKTQEDFRLKNGMQLTVADDPSKRVQLSTIDNSRKLALGMPIDINQAAEEDLLLIPGIGSVTAKKILEVKRNKIRFSKIEELMEIKGIKEKKLAKLRLYLHVDDIN